MAGRNWAGSVFRPTATRKIYGNSSAASETYNSYSPGDSNGNNSALRDMAVRPPRSGGFDDYPSASASASGGFDDYPSASASASGGFDDYPSASASASGGFDDYTSASASASASASGGFDDYPSASASASASASGGFDDYPPSARGFDDYPPSARGFEDYPSMPRESTIRSPMSRGSDNWTSRTGTSVRTRVFGSRGRGFSSMPNVEENLPRQGAPRGNLNQDDRYWEDNPSSSSRREFYGSSNFDQEGGRFEDSPEDDSQGYAEENWGVKKKQGNRSDWNNGHYRDYDEDGERRESRFDNRPRDDRDSRDQRDERNSKDNRDSVDQRDNRDERDWRDRRDSRDEKDWRDRRDSRDEKDWRDRRDSRDERDWRDRRNSRDERDWRDQRDSRDERDWRDQRDSRDERDWRDQRDSRDERDWRDQRDSRDERDWRDQRDSRDERDWRDQRDQRDSRDERDWRDQRDQRGSRDERDWRDRRDWRDDRDSRDHRDSRDYRDSRDHRDSRDRRDSRPREPPKEQYFRNYGNETEEELFSGAIPIGKNFDNFDSVEVTVSGQDAPEKIEQFNEAGLCDTILDNIDKCTYKKPTPVQKYALPIVMSGRDMMACAQSGSGKTAAFLIPIINCLLVGKKIPPSRGLTATPQLLVLAPTRELAIQIYLEARKLTCNSHLLIQLCYGGTSHSLQRQKVQGGCNILIATPGRLLDFMSRGVVSLARLRYFVIDEADRMLDMSFFSDVEAIIRDDSIDQNNPPQILMFSATFPDEVQRLARMYLRNYVFIAVGIVGAACSDVEQRFYLVERFEKKEKLLKLLQGLERAKTLVFVEKKRTADIIAAYLSEKGFATISMHGDREQRLREEALREFRSGRMTVLVATAVASRGLDISNISYVVNFDLPQTVEEYVHRIGRTGRIGNRGLSLSFYDPSNDGALATGLARILTQAQQEVPSFLGGSGGHGNDGWGESDRNSSPPPRDRRRDERDRDDRDRSSNYNDY